jgi:hypothetical protein
MKNTEYNGWTNYETWRINLEMVDGNEDMANWDADAIQDWCYDYIDEESTGIANDLARSVLREVNWMEIRDHLRDEFGICRNCNEETENTLCDDCESEKELPYLEKG